MKLGQVTADHEHIRIDLILTNKEIEELGGPEAAVRACERAVEEDVRAIVARLEYMRETEGGFAGGTRPGGPLAE